MSGTRNGLARKMLGVVHDAEDAKGLAAVNATCYRMRTIYREGGEGLALFEQHLVAQAHEGRPRALRYADHFTRGQTVRRLLDAGVAVDRAWWERDGLVAPL